MLFYAANFVVVCHTAVKAAADFGTRSGAPLSQKHKYVGVALELPHSSELRLENSEEQ